MASDPDMEKIDRLTARIHDAEHRPVEVEQTERVPGQSTASISGIGFDFGGAVVVCGFLGWLVDKEFGTGPWGIVGMLVVGFVIGITNVWGALSNTKSK